MPNDAPVISAVLRSGLCSLLGNQHLRCEEIKD